MFEFGVFLVFIFPHSKSSRYEQFLRSVRIRGKPYSGIFFALLQNAFLWKNGKFNVWTVFLLINSQFCDICIWRRKGFSSYFEHTNISLSFFRNLRFFAFLFFYVFFFFLSFVFFVNLFVQEETRNWNKGLILSLAIILLIFAKISFHTFIYSMIKLPFWYIEI